jgi:hypothetical protein
MRALNVRENGHWIRSFAGFPSSAKSDLGLNLVRVTKPGIVLSNREPHGAKLEMLYNARLVTENLRPSNQLMV